ncbi:MAG: hypothetical protein LBE12_08080 [Planctomycetaceae bacterium]|jgi:hypothetical protein|nr:hypothetical protein [Planctomycetaceae bacterium]
MLKRIISVTFLLLLNVWFCSYIQADWTNIGTINGVQVYRDNLTGLEWTTTLGRVPSSDWGSSARGLVARYGFRLPSFHELQQMQRHGGFSHLNIHNKMGNYYETSNSRYLANAAINGFQTPQERKGTGQNWVVGVRNAPAEEVIIVQETVQEQNITVTPVQVETVSATSTGNVTVTSVQSSVQTPVSSATATINPAVVCVPNPVSVQIPFVLPGTIKSTLAEIKESLKQKTEILRNTLSATTLSLETIITKMKENNVTVADQSAMITAFEEGDAATVQRIWIVVANNIKEAGQLSQAVKVISALGSFGESIEEGEFSTDDFKDVRKTIEKSKWDKETDKTIKPVLNSITLLVGVHEQLSALRSSKATKAAATETVTIPDENVTLIIRPEQNPKEVFAVDEHTFIVGKKGELVEAVEGTLDDFVQKPIIIDETPMTSPATENQITLSNPAENTESVRFSLDNETKTLAVGETQSYPLPSSGAVKIYTTKTRTVSSGRRRGNQTQTYQDSQSFSVTAGITYDVRSDSEKGKIIVPRPVEITLDNRNGTMPFHLTIEDQPIIVEPSATKTFKADNGILTIQFAQSEEPNDIVSIKFYQSQTCKPAIAKNNNKWALFPVP